MPKLLGQRQPAEADEEEVLTLQAEPRLELRSAVIGVSELTHLREMCPDWSLAWRGEEGVRLVIVPGSVGAMRSG